MIQVVSFRDAIVNYIIIKLKEAKMYDWQIAQNSAKFFDDKGLLPSVYVTRTFTLRKWELLSAGSKGDRGKDGDLNIN